MALKKRNCHISYFLLVQDTICGTYAKQEISDSDRYLRAGERGIHNLQKP
jgi:hypothetical protein